MAQPIDETANSQDFVENEIPSWTAAANVN